MARLIRTEKEVEGRYEEVWLVVEEDALDQWPAGPREVVGQPAARASTASTARAARRSTPPTCSCRDAARRGAALAARARARDGASTSRPRSRCPGVHAAIGPGDIPSLVAECGYEGAAVAAVCADTLRAGDAPPSRRSTSSGRSSSRCSTPTRRSRASQLIGEPRVRARGDFERGLAEADVVRHRRVPHPGRAAQLDGDPPVGRAVGRRHARGLHLDAVHLGRPRRGRGRASGCRADKVRVVCHYMGGGFGSKNDPDDYTFIAIELATRDAAGPSTAR